MDKTARICANGHPMDPDWEVCPFCPGDRAAGSTLARTVKFEDPELQTRERPEPAAPPGGSRARPGGRRTEVLTAAATRPGLGWLVGLSPPDRGRMHVLEPARITLGAGPECDIIMDATDISDRHASFRFREGGFHLTDLDSTNGTFVNGEPVQQHALADSDRVAFGTSEWVFKCVIFDR